MLRYLKWGIFYPLKEIAIGCENLFESVERKFDHIFLEQMKKTSKRFM